MESSALDRLGARLLQARLDLAAKRGRPVSQREIAEAVGVHQKTLAAWEQGNKRPSLETVELLARALETDPGALAFGIVVAPLKEVPPGTPGALPVHELRTERPAIPASEALAREQKRGKDGGKKRA